MLKVSSETSLSSRAHQEREFNIFCRSVCKFNALGGGQWSNLLLVFDCYDHVTEPERYGHHSSNSLHKLMRGGVTSSVPSPLARSGLIARVRRSKQFCFAMGTYFSLPPYIIGFQQGPLPVKNGLLKLDTYAFFSFTALQDHLPLKWQRKSVISSRPLLPLGGFSLLVFVLLRAQDGSP